MNMKKIVAFIVGISMLTALTGCNNTVETSTGISGMDSMRYVGLKVYDPVYIAEDKGFFDKNGIEVEIVDTVAGGATAVEMVTTGNAEAALLSTMAIINAKSAGMPVIGVADIQSSFEDAPLEVFFVREDSGINSVSDLKGKKIAINLVKSSFHYTWLIALEQAGLSEKDVEFVTLPFSEQQAALDRGDVDAIGLMSPYIKSARNDGEIKELYNACDVFGERQFCEIFVNENWANSNTDSAEKFVISIAEAEKWAMDNQEEAKTIISKYTGIAPENIEDYHFQENAECVEDDAAFWLEYMKNAEETGAKLTVSDIVTNKYNGN